MEDFEDDDLDEEFRGRDLADSDSDMEEYDYMNNKDTTVSLLLKLGRAKRLKEYKNYENVPHSGDVVEKDCKITRKGGTYYEFRGNSRSVKSSTLHFQMFVSQGNKV